MQFRAEIRDSRTGKTVAFQLAMRDSFDAALFDLGGLIESHESCKKEFPSHYARLGLVETYAVQVYTDQQIATWKQPSYRGPG